MELEQRVANLEEIVKGIAALPQLSVIAMQESQKQIESFKEIIKRKEKELKIETIPPTRRELKEDIEEFEYLISPAICADSLYSNNSMENPPAMGNQQQNENEHDEFREICQPVIEYIQKKYGSPHHRVIIDWSSATLVQDLRSVGFKVPD